ncbi:MAG: nucleotide sugar dehydrogenase [Kiloniellales bacterium]|nr:nucleotide sugar dehydrogenase [Kiloniellales bacterium]
MAEQQESLTKSRDSGFTSLLADIEARKATVGIIGLGYVGLPLVQVFCEAGYKVLGFDIDPEKVDMLAAGQSYIRHITEDSVQRLNESGRFGATTDFDRLGEADAILICVPTPLGPEREPDMRFVVSTTEALAGRVRPRQLIVLESTTYPGTTVEVMKPILERSGLKAGSDFFLAYSPEREDPGNPKFGTATIPKVIGGDGPEASRLAAALYQSAVVTVVPVSSTQTAEAVKLTENIFRAVNIALVNELKQIYEAMGIDVWEVIHAAESKPFGFMPFYPGPGLGGHCIPIAPFYLTWRARQFDIETRFIELAGEVNTAMPAYVVARLAEALGARGGKPLKEAKILLVGLAYKKNVDDIRESPGFVIVELLQEAGAKVDYYDPYVPTVPVTREHPQLAGQPRAPWTAESIASYDAAVVCTDHDDLDYGLLVEHARLIVDSRNVVRRKGFETDKLVQA